MKKREQGFASILMVSIVFIMILVFLGTTSVYFSRLGLQIAIQQRVVAGQLATEDLAKVIAQARAEWELRFNGVSCGGSYKYNPDYNLCFRRPNFGSTPHCVRHPLGNTSAFAGQRLICLDINGFATPAGAADASFMAAVTIEPERPFWDEVKVRYYAFYEKVDIGLDIIAAQLQNAAMAQAASQTAHLPAVGGAPTSRLGTNLACAAPSTHCKECGAGGNLNGCIRLQVCLRPGGCTNDADWVRRTVGLLPRN